MFAQKRGFLVRGGGGGGSGAQRLGVEDFKSGRGSKVYLGLLLILGGSWLVTAVVNGVMIGVTCYNPY